MSIDHWTYEDFLTYLLILGAKADLEFTDEEREAIVNKVGEEEFEKVERVFNKQNDAQHIETVAQLYSKYKDRIGGKENLINELKGIFTTGGSPVNTMDTELLMMLKRIL